MIVRSSYGTNGYLYEIAKEWKKVGKKAHEIWDQIDDSYGEGLNYIHDDLCRLIMIEVYGNKGV